MLAKIVLGFAILYLLAGILTLVAIPASLYGWFGVEQDPLSGVFALLLAMPWSLLLRLFEETGTVFATIFCAAGIGVNFALLLWLSRSMA